ncbi:MAG: hypothetical protein DHS20C15_07520 [Planctomycetota bacterium]|nr:MAG: hypothetical protein DHS20C15_07520 [Planctomycetota bacterium]
MTPVEPSTSRRPRRSRVGFVIYLVVLLLATLEVVNVLRPGTLPLTPLSFLRASWAVATGGELAHNEELSAKLAYQPTPYVMYRPKPNFTRKGEPLRTTNSLGFRGPEIEQPKPAGRTRLLCLGGSTTYSFAVDDEHTYPVLLEQSLRERLPTVDLDVINGGVESYTTAESLANLAHRGLDLAPDYVLIYHAPNDVRPRRYANFTSSYAHYRKSWNGSTAGARRAGGELGGINALIQFPPPSTDLSVDELLDRNAPIAYRRNLTSLVGVARAHGIAPVFITFAGHPEPGDVGLARGIEEHNQVMRALAEELAVFTIDLAAQFPADAALFADDIHLLDDGNALKAELLAEGLLPLLQ